MVEFEGYVNKNLKKGLTVFIYIYAAIVTLLFLVSATPQAIRGSKNLIASKKKEDEPKQLDQSSLMEKAKKDMERYLNYTSLSTRQVRMIEEAVSNGEEIDVSAIFGINKDTAHELMMQASKHSSLMKRGASAEEQIELIGGYFDICAKRVHRYVETNKNTEKALAAGKNRSQAYLETMLGDSVKNTREEKTWDTEYAQADPETKRVAREEAEIKAKRKEAERKKAEHERNMDYLRPSRSTLYPGGRKTHLSEVVNSNPHSHYMRKRGGYVDPLEDMFDDSPPF